MKTTRVFGSAEVLHGSVPAEQLPIVLVRADIEDQGGIPRPVSALCNGNAGDAARARRQSPNGCMSTVSAISTEHP